MTLSEDSEDGILKHGHQKRRQFKNGIPLSQEEVQHDPEFHVSLQAERRHRLALEDPQVTGGFVAARGAWVMDQDGDR
jgi:hypothetical protein